MKSFFKLFLFFTVGILISCDSEKSTLNKIEGGWIIAEFQVDGINYFDSLGYNYIRFKKNTPRFPIVTIYRMSDFEQEDALFNITSNKDKQFLKIDSKNTYFNTVFSVEFFDDPEHNLLFLHLVSDRVTLTAYKRENYIFGF